VSEELWQVRIWDMMDGTWTDVGEPVTRFAAETDAECLNQEKHGKPDAGFDDGDYFKAFPAESELHWSNGREMFR
jgi:hypothetical protein